MILWLLIGTPLFSFGIFDKGDDEAPEPEAKPTAQEIYDGMDESLPGIGFFTPELQGNVTEEEGAYVYESLCKAFVAAGEFKPYSLNEWYTDEFGSRRARDILEVRYEINKQDFPLRYFGTLNICRLADKYLVQLGVYTPRRTEDLIYIYRVLDDLQSDWDYMLPDILNELDYRLKSEETALTAGTLFVEPFTIRYYQYYELNGGEYSFTELPFLSIDGEDFHSGDDMFSRWLGLRLHLSGIFPVVIHDLKSRVREGEAIRYGCTRGLRGEVRISEVMSVLRLQVYDYKRREIVSVFDLPFHGLTAGSVASVIDESLPFILDAVLSEEAQRRVTVVEPRFEIPGERIYTERGYQGPFGVVNAFPTSVGLNKYLLVEDEKTETKKKDESGQRIVERTLFIPELSSFNNAVLVGPDGAAVDTYSEKDILYAEKLFE